MTIEPNGDLAQKIGVVIPYFQSEPGLLQRAVRSALDQTGLAPAQIKIVVVDDESPLPAKTELEGILSEYGERILIIEQTNRGAGVARNTGLDHLPADTEYVAFLDSDDIWSVDHLANAKEALRAGADFYFADQRAIGEESTCFERHHFPFAGETLPLLPERSISRCSGDFICVVLQGFIMTPTVVYNFRKHRNIRFPDAFQRFGEDQFVWAQISQGAELIAISENCEALIGKGVSIYSDQTFGTLKSVARLRDEIRFRKALSKSVRLSETAARMLWSRLRDARRNMAAELLHHLRRGRIGHCLPLLCEDPMLLFYLFAIFGRVCAAKAGFGGNRSPAAD